MLIGRRLDLVLTDGYASTRHARLSMRLRVGTSNLGSTTALTWTGRRVATAVQFRSDAGSHRQAPNRVARDASGDELKKPSGGAPQVGVPHPLAGRVARDLVTDTRRAAIAAWYAPTTRDSVYAGARLLALLTAWSGHAAGEVASQLIECRIVSR